MREHSYAFNKHFLNSSFCDLDTLLGTEDIAENKTGRPESFHGALF